LSRKYEKSDGISEFLPGSAWKLQLAFPGGLPAGVESQMDPFVWVLLTFVVLALDLAIGLAIGWRWGRAVGEQTEAAVGRARLDRTIRSINDLLDTARLMVHQTDEYMAVVNQVGAELDQLPPESRSAKMGGLLESLRMMRPDLEQRRAQFDRQLEIGHANLAPRRRDPESSQAGWKIELVDDDAPKATSATGGTQADARREARQPYRCRQSVAPYTTDRLPTPESFHDVDCLDISERGVGFVTSTPPTSAMIVITTGVEPDVVYRTARVVSVQELPSGEGPLYRVGCEFIGRLSRHLF